MQVHLFGARTSVGESVCEQIKKNHPSWLVYRYSRKAESRINNKEKLYYVDFTSAESFEVAGSDKIPSIWISYSPIWLFNEFLMQIARDKPECLDSLVGIIACSSSSVLTKRYAFSSFDQDLYKRLKKAEDNIEHLCKNFQLSSCILQPTLIYGRVGQYSDQNVCRILRVIRTLPMLPLPEKTGLRQPIHAVQVAAVTMKIAEEFQETSVERSTRSRLSLGGDSCLSYREMISAIQCSQVEDDRAHTCLLLSVPNRVFFFLATPLLLLSPKTYEALLRMAVDLSGFTPVHKILGCDPEHFPINKVVS